MFKKLLIICLMLNAGFLAAQDKSNRGKEFWLAYGFDYSFFHESPVNNQELAIYISTVQAATVTVSVTNTGYTQTLNIPANTVNATIRIPKSGANDARTLTDGLQNRNIHIVSNEPVAVYAHVYSTMVSGATMLMPVETYGYTYRSINYYQTTSQSSPADWYSWFYVIASEDNTRLNITPSDSTKNGWMPGQTYTINLNKGESYHVFGKAIFDGNPANASKDMTGSKVVSIPGADGVCHPVALFSGSGGIRLCRGDGGEFIHQQVFPTQAWGTRYLTYHTINNTNTDINETNRNYYRICVLDPATVVRKNGVIMTGLVNNFFYEHMDSTGGDYFTADKPIMVSQYTPNKNQCWNFPTTTPAPPSYGDPEMFYLSPIEQGQKSVLFYTSRLSSIDYVYANIIIPTTGVPSLRIDGNVLPAAQIKVHPNLATHSVALARFTGPAAQHSIVSDSAFTATVYGIGNYESYGYNVGTLVNNLNHYGAIANVNNSNGQIDTFTCKNTPVRLFVKLAYPATSIHWKLSQVQGMSPNTDSIISSPVAIGTEIINGRTYYIYSLQQDFTFTNTGTFYLPVSFTSTVIENCSQTEEATIKIVVKDGPTASYNYSSGLCMNETVSFTGNSLTTGFNITGYEWLFDDNSTATTVNTTKQFLTVGPHDVRYRIIADNGCIDDTIRTVNILDQPVAKFGVDASICRGDSVYITDTSTVSNSSITTWHWDFGDGATETRSNGNPFYHAYATPGNYTVKLVVTSANGCSSDTLPKPVTVLPRAIAGFTYDRDVCLGQSIQFTNTSMPAAGGIIAAWNWNFGDGNTVTYTNGNPFSYTYTAVNSYIVTLTVRGSNGCLSEVFRDTLNVTSKPSSAFTYTGKACVDSSFIFTSATTYNASVPSSWYWEFGDGQTINITTGNSASHNYAAPATNIRVRHAVSYGGCPSDTTTQTISLISANPTASFNAAAPALCVGMPVQVSGSGSADISSWSWNMGNGTSTAVPPFTHMYNAAGNYTISLTVQNNGGCQTTVAPQSIAIAVKPVVDAGPDIYKREAESKTILAGSNNAGYDFLWSPGINLSATNILSPVTNSPVDIMYRVTATDRTSGCIATDSMFVKIITTIYVPNAFTPNGDGRNEIWRIPALAGYPNSVVMIFNRYSQKIFESKGNNNGWDGTFKGQPQPIGAYIYIIDPGEPGMKPIKGTVTIIR